MKIKKLISILLCFAIAMSMLCGCAVDVEEDDAPKKGTSTKKKNVAAMVGDHQIDIVEMNYFYRDAISGEYNQWYQQYPEYTDLYIQMMTGLDPTKNLDEQFYDESQATTWADHFIQQALENARTTYALYDKAMAENYTLSAEDQAELDKTLASTEYYATMYGYTDADSYLRAMYGNGASMKSYSKYVETQMIVYAYTSDYAETLDGKFDDAAIRKYDSEHPNIYDSFTYTQVYLQSSLFQGEGTKDENGTVTYTDEEKDAARAKAKEAADALAAATTEEEFKKLVSELEINAEKERVSVTKFEDTLYDDVMSVYRDWVAATDRAENQTTVVEGTSGSGDEKVITGYYVIMFHSRNDNAHYLSNVRHLLVQFEGGTTDENGNTVYSDEDKANAYAEVQVYLDMWQSGPKTKESFIELVKAHTDDTASAETGGLYEDISPQSSYVSNFLKWSIDPDRRVGDVEIIETEYGYHLMYFDSYGDTSYRDIMIKADMRSEAYETWYIAIVDPVTIEEYDLSELPRNLTMSAG